MVNVEEEVQQLKQEIKRLGKIENGKYTVPFGVIVMDDRCSDIFEALVGTLRAAKKRKVVYFEGEMLLKGAHDKVNIILLEE
jgi:hypothetical protein